MLAVCVRIRTGPTWRVPARIAAPNPIDRPPIDESARDEVARRRTFAIISHPDAGKTTLTEKLLLFGGAIQMAGTVKGRKAARHATSDWMRARAAARHLGDLERDAVPLRGAHRQPARHARATRTSPRTPTAR